jgi:hypothetical protein
LLPTAVLLGLKIECELREELVHALGVAAHREDQPELAERLPTSTGVTFDAPRVPIETIVAGGQRQRGYQHADHFWGCALSTYAASSSTLTLGFAAPSGAPVQNEYRGYL